MASAFLLLLLLPPLHRNPSIQSREKETSSQPRMALHCTQVISAGLSGAGWTVAHKGVTFLSSVAEGEKKKEQEEDLGKG